MPLIFTALLAFVLTSSSLATSFHWVDRNGFHTVDRITKVPLEHRKDLPMVKNEISLPFTAGENRDGAMYVWFILDREKISFPYIKAADYPRSPFFKRVQEPQPADIAWWKGYVAIYRGGMGTLLTARSEILLKSEEKKRGKATWYRFIGPSLPLPHPPGKAPQKMIRDANETLLRLDKAAVYPPEVKDDAERDRLRDIWEKGVVGFEQMRKRYPEDPQVLRLMGVYYRLGYNLGMPGAWERAEAFLLKTEEMAPEAPEAYISLGILYGDSSPEYAKQAEQQFRMALSRARKEQLPQIWWGLSLALHYQGKTKEAVEVIDRLISLRPDDDRAKKLRETFLAKGKEEK